MKVLGVIPARYASTRFPGKPLQKIFGKPLLQWVIEGAQTSHTLNDLCVATDDERIFDLCRNLNVNVEMTSPNLASGSDRVWAACKNKDVDVVVNIQGDEPLIKGSVIDSVVNPFSKIRSLEMATLCKDISAEDFMKPQVVKVIVDEQSNAIYFSRFTIPFSRVEIPSQPSFQGVYQHVGIYAYRKDFLEKYCQHPQAQIELAEGLEQLRALYMGAKIKVITTDHDCIGVDTPEDITIVEKKLRNIK